MDPELSEYYQQELHYIHALFQEFAKEHPKVARRLGAHAGEVVDPYVERLLQSFALTAARSQMRIDRMPDAFTSRLLQSVYPNYVTPLPSMALVRFRPDYKSGQGAGGQVLPRGTNLASRVSEHVRSESE